MKIYLDLLKQIMDTGQVKTDRTGVGTISTFGAQMRFDLAAGFPLLTTKKVHFKSLLYELLWFLRGDTNVKWLQERGVRIWNEWADENGDLGKIYGKQWRDWSGIDQIANVISEIKNNPNSRRLLVSAWNVSELHEMALAPCHCLFQFYVSSGKLSCQLYQRSADIFLGVPFNIASYSLLTMMIAEICNLQYGDFIWTGGDVHLYSNHIEQAKLQLTRSPKELPTVQINKKLSIDDYEYEDFTLCGYDPYPAIKALVAV